MQRLRRVEDLRGELVLRWCCRLGLELLELLQLLLRLENRLLRRRRWLRWRWLLLREFRMKRRCFVTGPRRLLRHGAM